MYYCVKGTSPRCKRQWGDRMAPDAPEVCYPCREKARRKRAASEEPQLELAADEGLATLLVGAAGRAGR
jgi:hypothetical protein